MIWTTSFESCCLFEKKKKEKEKRIMINVNVSVKNIVCAKKIVLGILAHVFVRIVGI